MVRHAVHVAGVLAAVVVLAISGAAAYVARTWNRTYDAPLPNIRVSSDEVAVARGKYIVFGPAHCVECHGGSVDALQQLRDGMPMPLSGGFKMSLGPLGAVYAQNLTPDTETGLGRYSDSQIARMMRWAVRPDGRATVNPMMPYSDMADDDLVAVISYLRAQPPVKNVVPANEWTLMGKIVKSFVSIAKPRRSINPLPTAPAQRMTKERGDYLAHSVANCVGCHTPRDPKTFAPTGPDFSGGFEQDPTLVQASIPPSGSERRTSHQERAARS
jgi:mono/diheme cytochrome c family protein